MRPRALFRSVLVMALGAACSTGRFEFANVQSEAEGRALPYGTYVPEGWDGQRPLPLVVLLHGAGDDNTSADRRSVVNAMDVAMEAGHVPPAIIVTPEGERGFWVNWHDGSHHWRDAVIDDVVPAVRAKYPTIDGAAGLHLMGISMGGGGGMQVWLDDPGAFASATILSAPILDEADTRAFLRRFLPPSVLDRVFGPQGSGSGNDPYQVLDGADALAGSRLFFGAATHDRGGILGSNENFHTHLAAAGVPHKFLTFKGGHGWSTWAKVFPYALCHQLAPACGMKLPRGWKLLQSKS